MSTRIFTFTHKKFTPLQDQTYIPIQVGAAVNPPLGYLSDATGDNISELNKYYGELTGMYWIWKNYKDSDYIGMCHYRRYFLDDSKQPITEEEAEELLGQYDIIVSNSVKCNRSSYFEDFAAAHNSNILKLTGEAIQKVCPEYYETYVNVFSGDSCHFGNLMILSHKHFNEYADWLFEIFTELEPKLQVQYQDLYHQRIFGFISENMISVWTQFNKLSVYECPIGITTEKAETTEFKLAMSQLFKMKQIDTASQMFYEYLKLRPDVRLPLSDLRGEIPIIEQLIYICQLEEKNGQSNTLDYSTNLVELIQMYRTVCEEIVKKQHEFIVSHHISWYMVGVIIVNNISSRSEQEKRKTLYKNLYRLIV